MEERNENIPKDTENKAQETILDKNESNMADASPRESDEDASTKETGTSEENSGENMVGQANESHSNTEPEVENDDEEKALGAIEATVDPASSSNDTTGPKSRIRSRWYRANERPLEGVSSPPATPMGEISLSPEEPIKDDLSDAKPPSGGGGRGRDRGNHDGDRQGRGRGKGRDGGSRGRGRDGGRGRRDSRERHRDRDREPGKDRGRGRDGRRGDGRGRRQEDDERRERKGGEGKRSRKRDRSKHRRHSGKDSEERREVKDRGRRRHEGQKPKGKGKGQGRPEGKTDAVPEKKKGGVGKFLSGLFGGK